MLSKEMWYGILIGTVFTSILAIPLGLATGLLFPGVQRWFDARSKARAFKKSSQTRKEYEEAYYFVLYPHRMTHYFLNRGLALARLGLFLLIAMIGSLQGLSGQATTTHPATWWTFVFSGGSLIFLLLTISQSVNKLNAIYYRVEFWGEYQKQVAHDLPDIEPKPLPEGR